MVSAAIPCLNLFVLVYRRSRSLSSGIAVSQPVVFEDVLHRRRGGATPYVRCQQAVTGGGESVVPAPSRAIPPDNVRRKGVIPADLASLTRYVRHMQRQTKLSYASKRSGSR